MKRGILCAVFVSAALPTACAEDLYVAEWTTMRLRRLDGSGQVLRTIPLPGHPLDMVVSAAPTHAFVSHPAGGRISVIRTADDKLVQTLPIHSPAGMAIGRNGTRLYVAGNRQAPPHLTVIDITPTPDGGRQCTPLASIDFSPWGADSAYAVASHGALVAVGTHTGHILLFDVSTAPPAFVAKRDVRARVNRLLFTPAGDRIYALLGAAQEGGGEKGTQRRSGNLHEFRSASLDPLNIIAAGGSQLKSGCFVGPALLYVTDVRGTVHQIDVSAGRVAESTLVGKQLAGIASSSGRLFVADPARHRLETVITGSDPRHARIGKPIFLGRNSFPVALAALGK